MKNIHVLSTDKPSRLLYDKEEFCYLPLQDKPVFMDCQHLLENRHIYIISDENIEIGNYYLCKLSMKPLKCIGDEYFNNVDEKKIILTTDQDLINDGIQSIDDEFLKWFIKNLSCEYIEVVRGFADGTDYGYNFLDYKIDIKNNN